MGKNGSGNETKGQSVSLCVFAKPTDTTKAECTAEGWHPWMAPIRKWVFVNQRIPGEIHAYCKRHREFLENLLRTLPV